MSVTVLFLVSIAATWQRWTHPFIDHAREMNLPVRLLNGERLYVDIFYYYGPLAPYLNALLFRLFGVHLYVLHIAGAVAGAWTLVLIRSLARRLVSTWESVLVAAFVCVTCATSTLMGSFIQPYSYAALYGWLFALNSLAAAVRYQEDRRLRWLAAAGACAGLALLAKPELVVLATLPPACSLLFALLEERRVNARGVAALVGPIVLLGGPVYAVVVYNVTWDVFFGDTYRAFSQAPQVYFARYLSGAVLWPSTGWAILAGTGLTLLCVAGAALIAIVLAPGRATLPGTYGRRLAFLIAAGALFSLSATRVLPPVDVTPLRSAPVFLAIVVVWSVRMAWRWYAHAEPPSMQVQQFLLVVAFALVAMGRVALNISFFQAYAPFTIPALVIVYSYLIFETATTFVLPDGVSRRYARRCLAGLALVVVVDRAVLSIGYGRVVKTYEVETDKVHLFTTPELGKPLMEALRYVSTRGDTGAALVSLPQGTIVNFATGRPNPLRLEVLNPGFMSPAQEAVAEQAIADRKVNLILLANILSPEYGARTFGRDYNAALLLWIESHYHPVAEFSSSGTPRQWGDDEFFIRAYERNP